MKVLAIDPALRHIAWSLIEWPTPETPIMHGYGVWVCQAAKAFQDVEAAAVTAMAWDASAMPEDYDTVVVETQHTDTKRVDPNNVRDLAMVTGSIIHSLKGRALVLAKTGRGRGSWSSMNKKVRHARLRDHWLVDFCKSWDADMDARGVISRHRADLMDTGAMSLWMARGCPRSGM